MKVSSDSRRRILSLWLPRLPIDRLKRLPGDATPDDAYPCVIVAKLNNTLQITALNDAAAKIGLEKNFPLANARAVCPDVQVFDADEAADAKLMEAIADWCDRFTPLVALDQSDGLLLDISGCAHLFGGEASMLRTVCETFAHQGFVVNAAIAGTSVCARTMTRAVQSCIVPDGDEARAVAPLPVFALGADDAITRGLRRAGLKTIGDVGSRAPHEITARFGAKFTSLLQQALGQIAAPISPRKPPPDFMVEKRFSEPVATDAVIAAILSGLAQMLVVAMDKQGKGARRLEASFFRTDGAVRTIAVDTGLPVTRTNVIDRLFRERLNALADPLDPGFGFDLIRLSASRVEVVAQKQRDFDARAQDNDDVAALVDRIVARLGDRRVVVHLPQETHIPERAAIAVSAQRYLAAAANAKWPARAEAEPPLRPLRFFERPEEVEVIAMFPDGPPAHFKWRRVQHRITHAEGPERIAMEWWRQSAETNPFQSNNAHTRDYFRVEDDEGCRYWFFREGIYQREVKTFRWFVQGIFA